jgi:phosphotransferase system enzyme I (PtsI)
VRLLLAYPQLMRTQLRALLRLSQEQTIRILVPMVALERDIQKIRELFEIVAREIGLQKLPPFGAMIETPAAALTVVDIARHSDFLCVGTNDLTQYTLAAGRDEATVGEYYVDDHPALLRLLGIVVRESAGMPVTICGELGSREDIIPKLLRMGFRGLSIAPSLIPTTKEPHPIDLHWRLNQNFIRNETLTEVAWGICARCFPVVVFVCPPLRVCNWAEPRRNA